jgi:hypothetical protein
MTRPEVYAARVKRLRKNRDALIGIRKEIVVLHRLAMKAMRAGDMKAVRAALDGVRDTVEQFAAILDKLVRDRETAIRKAKKKL